MKPQQEYETGYCVICGSRSLFRFDPTIITPQLQKAWGISDDLVTAFNRKESMFCDHCGSSLRIRRLAAVLIETLSQKTSKSYKSFIELLKDEEFRRLKIAEINACGTLHSYLKEHPNLYYSEWVSHVKPGEVHEGIRCEDLQCLTYPDNRFDIILTSETLEHVPNPDRAWHEIYRTLKNGGCHIFTIPAIPSQQHTVQRAELVDGLRKDLLEPAYHGDGSQESMFVYTDFGMDVVEKLDKMGLKTEVFYLSPEDELDMAMIFRSRKHRTGTLIAPTESKPMLEDTGKRYLPWTANAAIGYEHLHRYAYAAQFVQNKQVLDLACGEGYGSHLLSRTAELVVGIDIDRNAIRHAINKYIHRNLQFKVGSITDVPIEGSKIFDVIVCFEAMENVDDHSKLLEEVKRLLAPEGLFIVSTSSRWAYSDEPQYKNPFHVHGLYFDEFKALLQKHFGQVKFLGQRVYCNSNMWPLLSEDKTSVVEYLVERNPSEFVFVETEKKTPLYVIALASDSQEEIEDKASLLVDVSNELLEQNSQRRAQLAVELHELNQKAAQLDDTIQKQQHKIQALRQSIAWVSKFAAGNRYLPTPPLDMIRHVGSVNEENFREVGMNVVCDLLQFGLLTNPDATIADIGCGPGRIAMFIAPALSNSGSYHGFDTWSEGIGWATENITSHYPNFVFKTLSDAQKDAGYRADFARSIDLDDNSCDLVLAISLFTHLKYDAARSFMKEIHRVMKKGARAYLTFFICDEESRHTIPYSDRDLDSDGYGFYHVEGSYADSYFKEKTILDIVRESDCTLHLKKFGFWRGDKYKEERWPGGYQDLFIIGKG